MNEFYDEIKSNLIKKLGEKEGEEIFNKRFLPFIEDECHLIVTSVANYHHEKLVFPAFRYLGDSGGIIKINKKQG